MKRWRLIEDSFETGPQIHTIDLDFEEAQELLERHQKTFPDCQWYVEPYDHIEKGYTPIPRDACDGWEDMFNH
jgi:hypothetical protein